jgi:hypothetical protein
MKKVAKALRNWVLMVLLTFVLFVFFGFGAHDLLLRWLSGGGYFFQHSNAVAIGILVLWYAIFLPVFYTLDERYDYGQNLALVESVAFLGLFLPGELVLMWSNNWQALSVSSLISLIPTVLITLVLGAIPAVLSGEWLAYDPAYDD